MCGHERVCTPACVSVCVCVSVWRDEGGGRNRNHVWEHS